MAKHPATSTVAIGIGNGVAPEDVGRDFVADALGVSNARRPKSIFGLGRGNVGKSLFLRWLIEAAYRAGNHAVICDGDRTNPSLSGYFDNVSSPATADTREVKAWLRGMIEAQIEKRFDAVIDLGGGDLTLKELNAEVPLVSFLHEHGIDVVAIHLIGSDPADLSYLASMEEDNRFVPVATVIVFNEGLVSQHQTSRMALQEIVTKHPIINQAIARGAKLVSMPRLEPAGIISSRKMSFFDAAGAGSTLGPFDRQHVKLWLRRMDESFERVSEWML